MLSELTFTSGSIDYAKLVETYNREGVVVVRGLMAGDKVAKFRETASEMIRDRLISLGHTAGPNDDLDALFNRLCDIDRKLGGEIYDHIRSTPQYYECMMDGGLVDVVGKILGTKKLQAPYDLSLFRIDRPSEDNFAFDWHQDYPYNLLSQNAVTAWFPLTDVEQDMGWLKVVPRAHREIRPIEIADPKFVPGADKSKTRARTLRMVETDFEDFERRGMEVPMQAGDVMFFHCNTPHRSGRNRSRDRRARWVINPRYGDLLDPSMVKRGWAYANRNNSFLVADVHPEITRYVSSADAL
jgi:ectoine hydroxylase-related dioxygenase (phytanoyl-CoA dioxygenase family)